MTLATLQGAAPSLAELLDAAAARSGAWVVLERLGAVVGHGTGGTPCPGPVAEAVVAKAVAPLRAAVTWRRGSGRLTGRLGDLAVTAVDLGDGSAVWFVGGAPDEQALDDLAAAARGDDRPVVDAVVAELLHPRGPVRRGHAPAGLLVVLQDDGPAAALSRRAAAATTGTAARVHCEGALVLVALPPDADAALLVAHTGATSAGAAVVPPGASDWVAAARLATAAAAVATRLGIPLALPADPEVAAELVVAEAHEAVHDLVASLPSSPLRRLEEHDERTSGELVASLRAWCRSSFDVPAAAAALHVHPNTLRYRLKRAAELSGLDLTRPRQLLALQLLLEV